MSEIGFEEGDAVGKNGCPVAAKGAQSERPVFLNAPHRLPGAGQKLLRSAAGIELKDFWSFLKKV